MSERLHVRFLPRDMTKFNEHDQFRASIAFRLGWKNIHLRTEGSMCPMDMLVGDRNSSTGWETHVLDYCHRIKDACEIIEWCLKDHRYFSLYTETGGFHFWIGESGKGHDGKNDVLAIADTAPKAICKAFLKLEMRGQNPRNTSGETSGEITSGTTV